MSEWIASTTARFGTSTIAFITASFRRPGRCPGISDGWRAISSRGARKEFWTSRAAPARGCALLRRSALFLWESISLEWPWMFAGLRCPMRSFIVGPAEKLPFADGQFDFVSCLGALEHFLDPTRALREMVRVATPDAEFLLLVPNADFPPLAAGTLRRDRPIERARGASVSAGLARTFELRRSYYSQALARPACLVHELDHARAVVFLAGSTDPGIDVAYLARSPGSTRCIITARLKNNAHADGYSLCHLEFSAAARRHRKPNVPAHSGPQKKPFSVYHYGPRRQRGFRRRRSLSAPWPGLLPFAFYAIWRGAISLIRNPEIEVVFGGSAMVTPLVILLARLFRRKAVVQAHGLDLVYSSIFYQVLCVRWLRYCDRTVANSNYTASLGAERGVSRESISVIPLGVDTARFTPVANCEELKIETGLAGRRVVLFVGRLARRKGVKEFIENCLPVIVREVPRRISWSPAAIQRSLWPIATMYSQRFKPRCGNWGCEIMRGSREK